MSSHEDEGRSLIDEADRITFQISKWVDLQTGVDGIVWLDIIPIRNVVLR